MNNDDDNNDDDDDDNIVNCGKVSGKDNYDHHLYFMTIIWWKFHVRRKSMLHAARMFDNKHCII